MVLVVAVVGRGCRRCSVFFDPRKSKTVVGKSAGGSSRLVMVWGTKLWGAGGRTTVVGYGWHFDEWLLFF